MKKYFSTLGTQVCDAELASLALLNVKRCTVYGDECRSTDSFHYAGQNMAFIRIYGSFPSLATALSQRIQSWYSEVLDASASDIDNLPKVEHIGHFTQMVQDRATHIGCAVASFMDYVIYKNTILLACSYAFTNILGSPVYEKGQKASKCLSGANLKYNALCSVNEVVVVPKRF